MEGVDGVVVVCEVEFVGEFGELQQEGSSGVGGGCVALDVELGAVGEQVDAVP